MSEDSTLDVVRPMSYLNVGGRGSCPCVVGGHRVTTIDVHAHCVVPKALALMGKTPSANELRGSGISEVGMRRLREMDEQGIDVEAAISINPFWYLAERDVAAEVIKVNNETLTEWCAAHPDRFPGLKICSAHSGGFLPSYAPRSDNSLRVAPDMDTGVKLKKKPTEYCA